MKIQRIKDEAPRIKSLFFKDTLCSSAKPGQFVMVWIPGVDEIPLSISSKEKTLSSVTVKEVGEATQALNRMKKGEVIGVRGPFGNYFTISGNQILVIGGGIGTAPLMMLTNELLANRVSTRVIEGSKTLNELLFLDKLNDLASKGDIEVFITTEDGSYGVKGLATDMAEKILASREIDMLYTCGNETMIRTVYLLAQKYQLPMQASLERIMFCAMGICGSCVIGRYRVCKDGPIFDQMQLDELVEELGRFTRGLKGEKIRI